MAELSLPPECIPGSRLCTESCVSGHISLGRAGDLVEKDLSVPGTMHVSIREHLEDSLALSTFPLDR